MSFDELNEFLKSEFGPSVRGIVEGEGDRIWKSNEIMVNEIVKSEPVPSVRGMVEGEGGRIWKSNEIMVNEIVKLEPVPSFPGIVEGEGDRIWKSYEIMKSEHVLSVPGGIGNGECDRNSTDALEVEQDLEDIFSALSDAQSEIKRVEKKWHSKEMVLKEENNALRAALDEESRRLTYARTAMEEQRMKVVGLEGDLDAALIAAKKGRRRLAFTRKHAQYRTKEILEAFDAIVITTKVQQEKVEAESKHLQEVVISSKLEHTKLQMELDAARASMLEEKRKSKIHCESVMTEKERVEEELGVIKGQRDQFERDRYAALLAVDEQKAKVAEECEAKLRMKDLFAASQCKRKRLEYDLIVAGEEVAEEKLKLDEAHKQELDQVQRESKRLRIKLGQALRKKRTLEAEFVSLGKRYNDVENNRQSLRKNLEEEKEKSLCQICLENPKDSTAFPCLHLNFCFSCLESHRIRTGTCPSCRVTITGILKCVLST